MWPILCPRGDVAVSQRTRLEFLNRRYGALLKEVTGVFINVAAQVAEKNDAARASQRTTHRCTLRTIFELNLKYLGGLKSLQALFHAEGHRMHNKGKRRFIANASDLREPKLTLKTKKPLQIDEVAP